MADLWRRTGPLSHRHERIHLTEGFGSGAGNLAFLYWIDGDLDRLALTAAVAELHRRHAVRRARHPDDASRSASTPDDYRLAFSDLSTGADPAGEVRRLLDESVNRLFDLADEAPVRWTLYSLGPGRHALTLVVHTIAFDAWSKGAIDTELSALYQVLHTGTKPAPASMGTRHAGGALVPEPLMREVERLGGQAGASAFMVLLAVFAGLLARHGGQPDILIGLPAVGQGELGPEPLAECFVDTIPFRIRLAGPDAFADLLSHVQDVTIDTHDRIEAPMTRLVVASRPDREPEREPSVRVVFQVNNAPTEPLRLTGLTVTAESRTPTSTDLDLTIMVGGDHDGPVRQWQYRTDLVDAGGVEDLRRYFQRILEQVVADPAIPLTDLLGLQATPPANPADLPSCEKADDPTAPRGAIQQAVAALFTELLGHERVGVDDNFFALGGHSLPAARLVALVRKNFQVELTLLDLFDNPTVAGVSAFIERFSGAAS